MRKLSVFMHVSLDGFVQGREDWDLSWITYDKELETYSKEILRSVDTVLWGRSTYLGMQQYWESVPENPESSQHELEHARWLERTPKIVFSTTLDKAEWANSRLVKDHVREEIVRMKEQPGNDFIIIGSPRFAHTVMELGLVDEYRLNINPIVLGEGVPLFTDNGLVKLKLTGNRLFDSGVVGLTYEKAE